MNKEDSIILILILTLIFLTQSRFCRPYDAIASKTLTYC